MSKCATPYRIGLFLTFVFSGEDSQRWGTFREQSMVSCKRQMGRVGSYSKYFLDVCEESTFIGRPCLVRWRVWQYQVGTARDTVSTCLVFASRAV